MAKITDGYAEEIINIIRDDTPFVALFNGDPESGGTEFSGAGYERKNPSLGAVSSKSSSNTTEVRWTNLPADTITHIAYYNDDTAGTRRLSGSLSSPVELSSGDEFYFSAGNLTIAASGA